MAWAISTSVSALVDLLFSYSGLDEFANYITPVDEEQNFGTWRKKLSLKPLLLNSKSYCIVTPAFYNNKILLN
jgi:hypothetical protein